jgi:hypothetical protein
MGSRMRSESSFLLGRGFVINIRARAQVSPATLQGVILAAADDRTRQRCIRVIRAASLGGASSSLHNIASAAALTSDLIFGLGSRNLQAVNAILAGLGKSAVKDLEIQSFKSAGFDLAIAWTAGYGVPSLVAAFGLDAVASLGCDVSFILVSSVFTLLLARARYLELTPPPAFPSA